MRLIALVIAGLIAAVAWFCHLTYSHLGDAAIGLDFLANGLRLTWRCLLIVLILENIFGAVVVTFTKENRLMGHLYATTSALCLYGGCYFTFCFYALRYSYPGQF